MPIVNMEELIVQDKDNRLIKGYATVEVLDRQYDLVPVDTMQRAMLAYMDRGGLLLYGHENKPVGKVINWNVVDNTEYGVPAVEIVGKINSGYKLDDEVWKLIQSKKLTGFSIGGTAIDVGEAVMKDGSKARVLKEIELGEISIVVEPANQGAVITAVSVAKSGDIYDKMTDEELAKAGEEAVKNILYEFTKEPLKKKSYPWKTCMREHHSAKLCGWIKAHKAISVGMDSLSEDYIMHEFILEKASRPSSAFMTQCMMSAENAFTPEGEWKEYADYYKAPTDMRRFCGSLWYHYFGGNVAKAEDWAFRNKKITRNMITTHQIHSAVKYGLAQDKLKSARLEFDLPPQEWLNKCVAAYDGSADPYRACTYLWADGYIIDKGVPIIDSVIEDVDAHLPSLSKSIDRYVEIAKPFAGMKDWGDCQQKLKNKYGKEARNKVCGKLKAEYEKMQKENYNDYDGPDYAETEKPASVACPKCDSEDLHIVSEDDYVDTIGDKEIDSGKEYTMKCNECGNEFKAIVNKKGDIEYEDVPPKISIEEKQVRKFYGDKVYEAFVKTYAQAYPDVPFNTVKAVCSKILFGAESVIKTNDITDVKKVIEAKISDALENGGMIKLAPVGDDMLYGGDDKKRSEKEKQKRRRENRLKKNRR